MNINYAYFRNPFLSEMRIFKTINSVREHIQSLSIEQLSIGFVPTMGALHEGHLSLVRRASRENDRVAVSIFVNPIQFNNPADLDKYPRDLAADVELLKPLLKPDDFIFAPSVTEMYPEPETRIFEFGALAEVMEGSSRPGHFNGVGVVVNKLFSIVQPPGGNGKPSGKNRTLRNHPRIGWIGHELQECQINPGTPADCSYDLSNPVGCRRQNTCIQSGAIA